MLTKLKIKYREILRNVYYSHFKEFNFHEQDFPRVIQLETSTVCNGKCPMCPSSLIKRKPIMDEKLFKKIIQECKNTRLEEIHPFFFNEPFIFPKFLDWLRYIRKELPNVKISVATNGSILTKEIYNKILNEKLIDELCFSLDSYNKETFKKTRGHDNFEQVLEHICYLKDKNIKLSVNFTVNKDNLKELKEFKSFWEQKGINYFISYDDGRKDGKPFVKRRYKRPCKQPFDYITILTTGEVVLCDMDALGKDILGDVSKNTIKDVWANERLKFIRQAHITKKRNKHQLCKDCKVTWT